MIPGIDRNHMAVVQGHLVVARKLTAEIKALRERVAELEKALQAYQQPASTEREEDGSLLSCGS